MKEFVLNEFGDVVESKTESSPKRGKILLRAFDIINGERQNQYGKPENNFSLIAKFWEVYLKDKLQATAIITEEDVALMMTLMKIARISSGSGSQDSYIDAAGYIGLADSLKHEAAVCAG